MTKSKKITLSASRDIPFNKLVLSQANVRRVKAGVSIEELAEDIARRTLLSSITVRPVLDDDGAETGMFEMPPPNPWIVRPIRRTGMFGAKAQIAAPLGKTRIASR